MKLPKFKVECDFIHPCVTWEAGDRKYHFWLNFLGVPRDEILHSNPIVPLDRNVDGHKAHNQTAKKWAPIVEGIVQKIADEGLLAKAQTEAEAAKVRAREQFQANLISSRLQRLEKAAASLPEEVRLAILALPDATRDAFVVQIENGGSCDPR